MFIPVLASTSTTLAAFFPLIFWPGIAGEFMFFLPVTLLAILSSSLVMALIFIPVIGKIFGTDKNFNKDQQNNLKLLETRKLNDIKGIQGKYIEVLRYCLDNPKKLIALTFVSLISIQIFYGKFGKGFEFFPPIEPDYAEVVIHARGNFSAIEKDKIVNQIEKEILKNKNIENLYSRSGMVKGDNRDESEDVIGAIKIEFIDWRKRPNANIIIEELKLQTKQFAGIYIEFIKKQDGPPKDKDIEIEIMNNNENQLNIDTAFIYQLLKEKKWAKNIDTDLNIPGIEWEISIDRIKADQYGVDIQLIGNAIQMLTHGLKVTEYMPKDSDEEVDIVIKYEKEYRTLDELDKILVEGKNGPVSLSLFVNRKPVNKTGKIARKNSTRSKSIKFDVTEGTVANNKVLEITEWLKLSQLLKSNVFFTGQEEDQNEAKEFLIKAFFIAVFLITIILIATFNSFYYCIIILSAIIFSTIGVMIGLIISGKPFGIIMSGIGVIALAGIVVNNNIVLLNTYKTLRMGGEKIKDAILRTGAQRLRPVMLTTLTTFFGLVPMAIGLNINFLDFEINFGSPSSQWWLQLSNAIVFGVMFSFILTLIITPCLILIGEKSKIFKTF